MPHDNETMKQERAAFEAWTLATYPCLSRHDDEPMKGEYVLDPAVEEDWVYDSEANTASLAAFRAGALWAIENPAYVAHVVNTFHPVTYPPIGKPFLWADRELVTYGHIAEAIGKVTSPEEAARFIDAYESVSASARHNIREIFGRAELPTTAARAFSKALGSTVV